MSKVIFTTKTLNMAEAHDFVKVASSLCFDNSGNYYPELSEFSKYYATLMFYTNYDPSKKSVEEVYDFIYAPAKKSGDKSFIDEVKEFEFSNNQYIDLTVAAELAIEEKRRPFNTVEAINRMIASGNINELVDFIGQIMAEVSKQAEPQQIETANSKQ